MWTNDGPALYLTADKSDVVREDDVRAAWLLVAAGGQIPIADAERYHLTENTKAKKPPANKLKITPANKDAPDGSSVPPATPPPDGAGGEAPKD